MIKGIIFDIKKYAIHDGPGIRTAFFLKGCPLRCWWCHNPESLTHAPAVMRRDERCIVCGECEDRTKPEKCPTLALEIVGREVLPREILKIAKQDLLFYDESGGGATFTGGEPLAQPDFLIECLNLCRGAGIHTAVDTSGFASPEVFARVSEAADLFLFDLKHIDPVKHELYTGVDNAPILDNLRSVRDVDVNIRIPLIPTVNDDRETLVRMAELIRGLKCVKEVNLLPYHTAGSVKYPKWSMEYKMRSIEPPAPLQIECAAEVFKSCGIDVKVGG